MESIATTRRRHDASVKTEEQQDISPKQPQNEESSSESNITNTLATRR